MVFKLKSIQQYMQLDDNFLEAIGMHRMTKADQRRVLRQLVCEANCDSRRKAASDPLSKIATA